MILDIPSKGIIILYESFCYQNCINIFLNYYNIDYPSLYLNSSLCLNMEIDKINKKISLSQLDEVGFYSRI